MANGQIWGGKVAVSWGENQALKFQVVVPIGDEHEEHRHFHAVVFNLRCFYVMKFPAIDDQVNNESSKNI